MKAMKTILVVMAAAGVEVRRYTQENGNTKEFYTEVPFSIDVDGPYYSLLEFFKKVGGLERIINIGNLKVAAVKMSNEAGVKNTYPYAPNETVVASCKATTFFSHEPSAAPAKAPAKK